MRMQSGARRDRTGVTLCIAAAISAAVGLMIGVFGTRIDAPDAPATPAHPINTTAASAANAPAPTPGSSTATSPSAIDLSNLTVTDRQTLVVDPALLDVFNAFLLKADADRADQLKTALKRTLPPVAYAEAVQIAERYQAYMRAHDELLAAQHLPRCTQATDVDIERVDTWRQQRDRLRQRLLGERVTQAWYQNDDAQLDQVLQEWRQRAADARGASAASPDARYPVPHWRNPADEAKHLQYMLVVVREAVKEYGPVHVPR